MNKILLVILVLFVSLITCQAQEGFLNSLKRRRQKLIGNSDFHFKNKKS